MSYDAAFECAYEKGKKAAQECGDSAINPYHDNPLGKEVLDNMIDGFTMYYHQTDISRIHVNRNAVAAHVLHMSWKDGYDEEMSAIIHKNILSTKSEEFRRGWMLQESGSPGIDGDITCVNNTQLQEFQAGVTLSGWRRDAEETAPRSATFLEGVLYGVCGDRLCDNPFQKKWESTPTSADEWEEAMARYKEFAEGYKWYKVAEISAEVAYTLYTAPCYVAATFGVGRVPC